ncbi:MULTISPECIES: GTP cyclohydrolase II [unclassified Oceanispirochaeta]|uniref:GTP cyclohydrolase II n=1 Tax=unclassified Oceanispirochaeta TaxID=2635722 RepID=UPI0018F42E90|nr:MULTISPECIES: GTP cyclohydrolase II [unclassified Oceanispirochaeta]
MKITVEEAAKIIRGGGMVIVTDHEDRENEGDLVGSAAFAGPEMINFMARNARGLICCALDQEHCDKAGLKLMSSGGPEAMHGTRFCTPIDAIENCSTGISAFDRSTTLLRLCAEDCRPEDFARPGHMFPILEAEGGLAARQGHTEASIYLMRQAGVQAASVICEMMDDDGEMVRGTRIEDLAREWDMGVLSVADLVEHERRKSDKAVIIPTEYGNFQMEFIENRESDSLKGCESEEDHFCLLMEKEEIPVPLVRIHSECLTGDLFGSKRCDCGTQLDESLRQINSEGHGYLIYLRQEGRGIGLRAKMKAYRLQDEGMDTLDANLHLGYPADDRDYAGAASFLKSRGIQKIRLLTNNPDKIHQLEEAGIQVERVPLVVEAGEENRKYIETKQHRMGHLSA